MYRTTAHADNLARGSDLNHFAIATGFGIKWKFATSATSLFFFNAFTQSTSTNKTAANKPENVLG